MMIDKQYQFNLTEKQVDMINELIKNELQYASDIDVAVTNGEELLSLLSYLNFELGFQKGNEEFRRVEDDTEI